MVRRMLCLLAAAVMAAGLALPAAAEQTGRILLSLDYGETQVTRGTVVLQYVAEPFAENYRLPDLLGGGIIRREDSTSPELARWLGQRTVEGGTAQFLDTDGCTEYYGLKRGLYLVTQTEAPEGYACIQPILIPIPMDGQWEVEAFPKKSLLITESPKTGQHPAPLLGAMGLVLSGTGLYFCMEKLRKK